MSGRPVRRATVLALVALLSAATASAAESFAGAAERVIAAREYQASRSATGLQAPNRAHDLRTYFEPTASACTTARAAGSPRAARARALAASAAVRRSRRSPRARSCARRARASRSAGPGSSSGT